MKADVAQRYTTLRAEIDAQAREAGRAGGDIVLVGVSKRQPHEAISAAIAAGLTDIGESYVQEAAAKLGLLPSVRKHYIGHIQTNKAKRIVDLFDMVQSVDREDAAKALGRAAEGCGRVLPVLLQLNISPTERFGVLPELAEALAESVRSQPFLRLEGVMAIGPDTPDAAEIARAFALAAKTLARVGGSTLSIGMSGDWREAVRAGSTMLRIGTGLFGRREEPQ